LFGAPIGNDTQRCGEVILPVNNAQHKLVLFLVLGVVQSGGIEGYDWRPAVLEGPLDEGKRELVVSAVGLGCVRACLVEPDEAAGLEGVVVNAIVQHLPGNGYGSPGFVAEPTDQHERLLPYLLLQLLFGQLGDSTLLEVLDPGGDGLGSPCAFVGEGSAADVELQGGVALHSTLNADLSVLSTVDFENAIVLAFGLLVQRFVLWRHRYAVSAAGREELNEDELVGC
jgi:hypothetical protein